MRPLPPLNTLRAFEAVARHKRFIHAADELCLTHGAVSKQIKRLEEHYGVKLFNRTAAEVVLTNDGQQVFERVAEALNLIADTPNAIQRDDPDGVVNLLVAPAFAAHWMIPKLTSFSNNHPGIRLNLETSHKLEDVHDGDFDLAIMFGNPTWPNHEVVLLADLQLFPVCSPSLLNGLKPIHRVPDLKNHNLLHEDDGSLWAAWLASNRITGIDGYKGHKVPEVVHLLMAAQEGWGVALGDSVTTKHYLRSGALVQPFKKTIQSPFSYYLIVTDQGRSNLRSRVFCDWVRAAIGD